MKASKSQVARPISTKLNPRAMNFAARCEVPIPHTMSAPTNGINQRRDKTPTMSRASEEPLDEPLAEHEEEQDDEPHDDDPGVALHLACLSLAQPPTGPDGLQADGVDSAVDHTPVEDVALHGHPKATATDRVHDPIDHIAVEPVQASSDADDDGPTERVVHVVNPVPLDEHPMDERASARGGEPLGGNPFRGVDGPGEDDAEDRDTERQGLEYIVRPRNADEREARLRPLEEHEVPEPLHRVCEEARCDREAGEDDERRGHHARRFMRMLVPSVFAVERHEPESERVERREEGRDDAEGVEQVEPRMVGARVEGDGQDLPLTEEPTEGHDARQGERAEQHDPRRDRHRLGEATHFPHVVRIDRVDHAPCGEEQERFEEGVIEQMIQGGTVPGGVHLLAARRLRRHHVRTGAEAEEHVCELGDRRERKDPLDVVVHDGHRRSEEGGEPAEPGDHEDCGERGLHARSERYQEDERPGGQVNARLHHRRGVDQGADRRRPLHGIWEPCVQWELGRLPDGSSEQEKWDQREQLSVQQADARRDLIEPERAEFVPDDEDGDEEEDVSDAGHQERLLRGGGRLRLVVPESDQKLQEVVRAHGPEHPRGEEAYLGVVPRLALLLVHVTERVDENQETEEGHEDEHEGAQVVDQDRDPDLVARDARKPDVTGDRLRDKVPTEPALQQDLNEDIQREDEGAGHRADNDVTAAFPEPSSDQPDHEEGAERKEKDQPYDPRVLNHGSPFQETDLVELNRAVGLVDRQEDRKPDRGFRRGHGDAEEGEYLAARVPAVRREGHEVQNRSVQKNLNRHEDDDPVASGEDAVKADAKQRGGQEELVLERNHGPTLPGSSIFAR